MEVVVTLKAPPAARELAAAHERRLAAAQQALERNVAAAIPEARARWHYTRVLDGVAFVVPSDRVDDLARVPGVARVWPNVRYHALLNRSPQVIGADKLWGPTFATAGNGIRIGIVDDGLDASHPFFAASGYTYPAGFPKGQTQIATPKVIVQRAFPPPSPQWKYAARPFDPENSFHATHVAGIAAGNHGTNARGVTVSGVAPNAYLGNYKALTIPTPGFGLDGNSAEIAAAIEAAVRDGMNVINLSLGEPEIEPSRDLVVRAIDGAAAAGVVPVVAAGNDFGEFGFGSVSSPGSASGAITVAAASKAGAMATFSSAGPTPVSLRPKPDVTAPGVAILSSVPEAEGTWTTLQGTSMAAPHVAGGAALLKQRHPTWTVAQIKSALEQTGDPVTDDGAEASVLRQGGGMIDLPRADNPLLFATPTAFSFPRNGGSAFVDLTDAGGGAGTWNVTTAAAADARLTVPPTVTVPGRLTVTAAPRATAGGYVVLTRGADVRRIPFFVEVSQPALARVKHATLARTGVYASTTRGGANAVDRYRYPTGGDGAYLGPERAYRVTVRGSVANFGVAVLAGKAVPHVTFAGDEHRLVGYTGLPLTLNPYFRSYGARRPIAGAVLPAAGAYDVVFDTRRPADAGPFRFRFWINDTSPPRLRVTSTRGGIVVTATDGGAGVDPQSVAATIDGSPASFRFRNGRLTIAAKRGTHRIAVQVSDYQETKNMEDVPKIKPNTATLRATVRVR